MTTPTQWQPDGALAMGFESVASTEARRIFPITQSQWVAAAPGLSVRAREWLEVQGFDASAGSSAYAPDTEGMPGDIWLGVSETSASEAFAALSARAPAGHYRIAPRTADHERALDTGQAALGWALGSYRFSAAGEAPSAGAILHLEQTPGVTSAIHRASAIRLTRNLINMPAQDLGPNVLSAMAHSIAAHYGALSSEITGEALLTEGYPAIHAVGRAASEPPRLVEIRWGEATAPAITLVGKGVCFDTGGLNLKAMAGMRHMKRDMGGAAVMLGLGALIMSEGLPVHLRILLPIVENAISGNAMRPGDLIATRDGATIEIENTDCEGRIILADALTAAVEEDPELVIDCATLTGSARTAFGGEIQALFASDSSLAQGLQDAGSVTGDAVWQMPLWEGYRGRVAAPTGDLLNMAPGGYAGAITAGLFLQHFARSARRWAHLDISAWNDTPRPGRPVGGEATGLSAIFGYLQQRYG